MPFLRSMGRSSVRVMGGEPTLNPEFGDILELVLGEGFAVNVFTHGAVSPRVVARLKAINSGSLGFSVNRSYAQLPPEVVAFYRALGHRIQLSVTLFRPDQPLDHVLHEISTYHLEPLVRLGLAAPAPPRETGARWTPPDPQELLGTVRPFLRRAAAAGVRVGFDCGMTPCLMEGEAREFLVQSGQPVESACGPIPDILPGLTVIPCLPLSFISRPLDQHSRWPQVLADLEIELAAIRSTCALPSACARCERREGCWGGCLARRLPHR